jgi:predicted Zn-dependent protease
MRDIAMSKRNRKPGSTGSPNGPVKVEHHHAVHYHAVVNTQWREVGDTVFTIEDHCPVKHQVKSFEVVDHPVPESMQPMPKEIAAQYPELVEIAQLASDAAIAKLEMLAARHPGVVVLNNLLAAAYSRRGRMADAMVVVEKNYKAAPEYLFGRIQYAQMCLAGGRADRVPAIFDDHFDLKLLYPHRNRYHKSEFIAFIAVAAEYYLAVGNKTAAKSYHEALSAIAPDHELTQRLGNLLPTA